MLNHSKDRKGKEIEGPIKRKDWIQLFFSLVGVLLYPFMIGGIIPFFCAWYYDKKEYEKHLDDYDYTRWIVTVSPRFFMAFLVGALMNLIAFVFWIPRGYFACYLIFPMNLLHTTLTFTWQSVVALILGWASNGCLFIAVYGFIQSRKVISKEEERAKILRSKAYQKRRENKFEESQKYVAAYEQEYQLALQTQDATLYDELYKKFLIGTDEYGNPAFMDFREFNQHALAVGTTGAGKTTLLQLIIDHACKFELPVVLVDGKGARATLEAMQEIAAKHHREVKIFNEDNYMTYNPVKYGNDIEIRDKLVELAETESVFYSTSAKILLQGTIQFVDYFAEIWPEEIQRDLENLQKFMLPRNVLKVFGRLLEEKDPTFYTVYLKKDSNSKKSKPEESDANTKSKEIQESMEEAMKNLDVPDEQLQAIRSYLQSNVEEKPKAESEFETIILDPDTLQLEDFYIHLKRHMNEMSEERTLFERLFVRYEHKDNPFHLYATSEALQMNINMLLDSELGRLFKKDEAKEELDLNEVTKNREIVYISLNGLIYGEFIRTLAQLIIGDINHLLSELYEKRETRPFLAMFDEPASYLNDQFIDMVNKGRGAGLFAIYSPQTLADIDKLDEKLKEQLIGNANTFWIGKTNSPTEIEYWANIMGTYSDVEVTSMVEQEGGFSDVGKQDWVAERGTKRNVHAFKFNPDRIRELRVGEFVLYRTARNTREKPKVVYVRNPLSS